MSKMTAITALIYSKESKMIKTKLFVVKNIKIWFKTAILLLLSLIFLLFDTIKCFSYFFQA